MDKGPAGHLSVPEVQEALGLTRQRVYQLIAMQRLPSVKIGTRVWVPRTAVNARLAADEKLRSNNCISAHEVATFFGVDVRTVRDWSIQGHLKVTKVRNRLCYNPADVAKFMPPTVGGSGRYPARAGTRRIRGRYYPPPKEMPDRMTEGNDDDKPPTP